MKKYTWSYIVNTFLVATNGNYHLAVKLAKEYDSTLLAGNKDPDIMVLYTAFHPIYLALLNAYNIWKAQLGTQHGKTVTLDTVIDQLCSDKIQEWDIAIQAVYKKGTGAYAGLLPHHRTPFQTKSLDDRITAVNGLLTNLDGLTPLAAVKIDVTAFLNTITNAQTVQQTAKKTTKLHSNAIEGARVTMCAQMFGDYGTLIAANKDNPAVVADWFPLKYMRHTNQIYFTKNTKPGVFVNIAKHTFVATDKLEVTTNTDAAVRIFLSDTKNDKSLTKGVLIPANTILEIEASLLGDVTKCSYLIIVNMSTLITADWSVEFL